MGQNAGERKPPPVEQISVLRPALLLIAIIILGAGAIMVAQQHYGRSDKNVSSDVGPGVKVGGSSRAAPSDSSAVAPPPTVTPTPSESSVVNPPPYLPVTTPPAQPAPVGAATRISPTTDTGPSPSTGVTGPSSIDNPPPLPSSSPAPRVPAPDVFAHARLYVDADTSAARARQADLAAAAAGTLAVNGGDPQANADAIASIADTAQARWFTAATPTNTVQAQVQSYVQAALSANARAVIVLDALPRLDCVTGALSGLASADQYRAWVAQVLAGLGSSAVAIILEPGALTDTSCLTPAQLSTRLALLSEAVTELAANPDIGLYLDAGTSHSQPAAVVASRLRAVGVAQARGFSLNVGNFYPTATEQAYGEVLAALLPGSHFVLDTSRNGNGALPDGPLSSCNPSGRALGAAPLQGPASPHQDANLWIKAPGESDGLCHPGDPAKGSWFESYAIGLVHGSSP